MGVEPYRKRCVPCVVCSVCLWRGRSRANRTEIDADSTGLCVSRVRCDSECAGWSLKDTPRENRVMFRSCEHREPCGALERNKFGCTCIVECGKPRSVRGVET